jgi:hypothetical protein
MTLASIVAYILNNKIARTIAIATLTLGGFWYVNKLSMNHAYDQGRIEGGRAALDQVEKINLDSWKATRDILDKKQADLVKNRTALLKQRDAIQKQFDAELLTHEKLKESSHNEASQIPSTDLVPRIRELLDELRGGVDSSPSRGLFNPGPGVARSGPTV